MIQSDSVLLMYYTGLQSTYTIVLFVQKENRAHARILNPAVPQCSTLVFYPVIQPDVPKRHITRLLLSDINPAYYTERMLSGNPYGGIPAELSIRYPHVFIIYFKVNWYTEWYVQEYPVSGNSRFALDSRRSPSEAPSSFYIT